MRESAAHLGIRHCAGGVVGEPKTFRNRTAEMNLYPAVRKALVAGMMCLLATAWAQIPSAATVNNGNDQSDSQMNRPQAPVPQIPMDSPYLGSVPDGKATD